MKGLTDAALVSKQLKLEIFLKCKFPLTVRKKTYIREAKVVCLSGGQQAPMVVPSNYVNRLGNAKIDERPRSSP